MALRAQRRKASPLGKVVDDPRGVHIAVGSTVHGIQGFRRSHLDALTSQRPVACLRFMQSVATVDAVQLVSLVTENPYRADQFIKDALGELESAVLALVNEQCNASRAAMWLYTHRNTLLRRLSRAEQLLPGPLQEDNVNVPVALEHASLAGWVAAQHLIDALGGVGEKVLSR